MAPRTRSTPRSAAAACAASSGSTAAARRRARPAGASRSTRGRSPTWSATCAWRRSRSSSSSPSNPATAAAARSAIVFWLIAAGDYLDGFLARVTGQYSRLGALLDPLIDRLTILAGAVVCWHFELLPRWALAAARRARVAMLAARPVRPAPRGRLEVNWPGRISVFPIMGGIFFALVFAGWVPEALLVVGARAGDPGHGALRPRRPARESPRRGCKRRPSLA